MKQLPLFFTLAVFVVFIGSSVLLGALQTDATIETRELKQAVCNVSPTKEGKYDENGCKTAFHELPVGTICTIDEVATVDKCTVNSDACTNSASRIGRWCTCTYTCSKRMAAVLD